ncbi:histidine phosphatase family protein [Paenibacillus sp. TRM 82003]|nr:histidine phosphatase family protein [Paenibacillus sp. TRM 82003]
MTVIGFIRHGVTDWNLERRAQGQTDIPLNETGRAQARALADRLRGERWDMIYSSDLSRAKETADTVARVLGLEVVADVRLREKSFGDMEGTTMEERVARFGESWATLAFGEESEEAVAERGMAFVADMAERHPGKRILAVSHGALIGITLTHLLPHVDTGPYLRNTSVTIVARAETRWECELYNCAKHIEEE